MTEDEEGTAFDYRDDFGRVEKNQKANREGNSGKIERREVLLVRN